MKNKHKKYIKKDKGFKFKMIYVISVLAVIILVASVITGLSIYNSVDKTLITVDGEKITQKELIRVMQEKEGEVYNYFKTKYAADTTNAKNFWHSSYGDAKENPIDYLKTISTEKVIEIKMQQIISKENKLIEDISYSTFLKEYKKEYERRQNPNEKVAGVRKIQEMNYFNEVFKTVKDNLKKKLLEENVIIIEDKETLAFYEAEKENTFKKQDYFHFQYVIGNIQKELYDKKEDIFKHKDIIINKLNEIKQKIEKGEDPKIVSEQMTDKSYVFTYVDQKMDEEFIAQDYEGYKIFAKIAADAPIGKFIDADFYENSRIMTVKFLERRDQGYTSYEEAKGRINDVVISENKYYEYINKRVNQASIIKNKERIKNTNVRSDGLY